MSDEMKREIETLKRDVETLKTDVSALRASTTKIAVKVSSMENQMGGLATREEMAKGFGGIMSKLDDFAGEVEASRRERALQDESFRSLNSRIGDHELRITRLEPRAHAKRRAKQA